MSLPHLILGALSERPTSGYDLDKRFQTSINHFWSTDRSQIYRALQKLKAAALVEDEEVVQRDYPNKRVYHITEAGSAELVRWLQTPLDVDDAPLRDGWLGQLFFGSHAAPPHTAEVMRAYLGEAEEELDRLVSIRDGIVGDKDVPRDERDTFLRLATLEYGIAMRTAAIAWLRRLIPLLETEP